MQVRVFVGLVAVPFISTQKPTKYRVAIYPAIEELISVNSSGLPNTCRACQTLCCSSTKPILFSKCRSRLNDATSYFRNIPKDST